MNALTEIAMKNMGVCWCSVTRDIVSWLLTPFSKNDTQLVSILYRTHKSLPTASKVSSLYIFDALSRAAKHHVVKHGITGDDYTQPGNCATFLLKVGGVVEGLFQDMVTSGSSESKVSQLKLVNITEGHVVLVFPWLLIFVEGWFRDLNVEILSGGHWQTWYGLLWFFKTVFKAVLISYIYHDDGAFTVCKNVSEQILTYSLYPIIGENEEDPWYMGEGKYIPTHHFVSIIQYLETDR